MAPPRPPLYRGHLLEGSLPVKHWVPGIEARTLELNAPVVQLHPTMSPWFIVEEVDLIRDGTRRHDNVEKAPVVPVEGTDRPDINNWKCGRLIYYHVQIQRHYNSELTLLKAFFIFGRQWVQLGPWLILEYAFSIVPHCPSSPAPLYRRCPPSLGNALCIDSWHLIQLHEKLFLFIFLLFCYFKSVVLPSKPLN